MPAAKAAVTPTNTYVEAVNTVGAVPGQNVEIEMNTKIFMNAVILNYVLPLIMLIIGIFAGSSLASILNLNISKDLPGFLLGLVLMAVSYTFVYFIDMHYKKTGKVRFTMKRVF